jgi:hypothetical protein
MAMIVRAFPILPGKEDAALKFAQAVGGSRKEETAAFLQGFGIRRESWHLQRTPQGAFVIVVTDLEDPPHAQAQAYGAAQDAFARWFKDNIAELCGIYADKQPLGPPTETIFAWDSSANRRKSFDAPRGA